MSVPQPFQQAPDQYSGVKGWLVFFCISLTILNPLFTLANLSNGYSAVSEVADRLPGLMTATVVDSVLSLVIMALGIFAGVSLWAVKPNAVQVAKLYLVVLAVYSVLEVPLYMAALPSSATDAFTAKCTMSVLRTLFYVGLWFAYLTKSKRVKATYFDADSSEYVGLNLGSPAPLDPTRDTPQPSKTDIENSISQATAPLSDEKLAYKVIALDGNEYSSLSDDVLRQWYRAGSINGTSYVQELNGTRWQRLADTFNLVEWRELSADNPLHPEPAHAVVDPGSPAVDHASPAVEHASTVVYKPTVLSEYSDAPDSTSRS